MLGLHSESVRPELTVVLYMPIVNVFEAGICIFSMEYRVLGSGMSLPLF